MSSTTEVISRWSTLLENFNMPPQQFYDAVVQAVEARQIPDAKPGTRHWYEGNLLTAKRDYLTISYKSDIYFAICAAPFGTGYFISWWLLQPPDGCLVQLLRLIPTLGPLAEAFARPWTFYRVDAATMFQTATHSAVMEVVDSITSEKGIRGLDESERKPVMREFFQR